MKRFVTEYEQDGKMFSGHVDAIDWEHAQSLAENLSPPQTVIGVLHAVVVANHWTEEHANQFTRAMAETGGEPPNADEFDRYN